MATDYDSPRKTDDDVTEDSLQELQARRMDKSSTAIDIDPDDIAESLELPGADLSNEELSFRVIPRQADEFTCSSCFLVHHRSQLADSRERPAGLPGVRGLIRRYGDVGYQAESSTDGRESGRSGRFHQAGWSHPACCGCSPACCGISRERRGRSAVPGGLCLFPAADNSAAARPSLQPSHRRPVRPPGPHQPHQVPAARWRQPPDLYRTAAASQDGQRDSAGYG